MPKYISPHTSEPGENHVRTALDFLIAVEPVPPPVSREEYEAATEHYRPQIASAMATLRNFAQHSPSITLERMQAAYYGLTNDPRYLVSADVSAILRGSLDEAWNEVGPWRR